MTRPRNRLQRRNVGKDGHYYLLDGEYVPGVTTALGIGLGLKFDIPSGWAARICADWVIERRHLLADPTWTNTELHGMIRSAPRNTTSDAAAKGKIIHAYGEQLTTTGEVELADEHAHLAPHVEQYAMFLDRWQIETIASEVPLANTTLRYAGTAARTQEGAGRPKYKARSSPSGSGCQTQSAAAGPGGPVLQRGQKSPDQRSEKIGSTNYSGDRKQTPPGLHTHGPLGDTAQRDAD